MSLRGTHLLERIGLPARDAYDLPDSRHRFPDGGEHRLEIPTVEGPEVLDAVLDEAGQRGVRVHRVSQGSGITLVTDDEIARMVETGRSADLEVSLFVGPRAAWDTGVQATTTGGRVVAASLRGADQLGYAVDDVLRACSLGLRSVLVADVGLLAVLGRLRDRGDLPADLVLKVSVGLPVGNPATAEVLRDLGADTLNLPVDLPMAAIAAVRQAVDLPLDVYLEAPDDVGGCVRLHEVGELVRVAAPVHLKLGVRNSPLVYPSGAHLVDLAARLGRERVRRAAIALDLLARQRPGSVSSSTGRSVRAAT